MNNLDEIKSRIGIVEVVSQYIRVEKSGSQYKARCPFHNERTPSFYVSPSRNTYHCFGCGVSGDIFKFVGEIEHLEFKDALKILADRAGVTLTRGKQDDNSRLLSLMSNAKMFYQSNLQKSIEPKKYIHDRGLTDETISMFEIGFASNNWRDLFIHLKTQGYDEEEMVEAGMIIKTDEGKYYDRFRGRIMFPINNVSGVTVGFTGRILPSLDDGKSGKYVNTPETKLYHKSNILFNFDKAKKYIADTKEVILAEGQMDVIASFQSGICNVIAVSGTAFTEAQVGIISRLADRVVLAFDNDEAGRKAKEKAIIMCLYAGLSVEAVNLTGKDIAEIVLHNPNEWQEIYQNREDIIINLAKEINQEQDGKKKIQLIKEKVIAVLRAVTSPLERDFALKNFARLTNTDTDSLKAELDKHIEIMSPINNTNVKLPDLNLKERIAQELAVLSKELKLENIYKSEDELPDDVFNRISIELSHKDALNKKYFEDLLIKWQEISFKEEHLKLTQLIREGDIDAISKLQSLVKNKK